MFEELSDEENATQALPAEDKKTDDSEKPIEEEIIELKDKTEI